VKVIGVGFGRTGTKALKVALERLGFGPCYHMSDIIEQPSRVRQWLELAESAGQENAWAQDPVRERNWDEVFSGFQSTMDWPAAAFWKELANHYPAAKIVLTIRDPERWYESISATIFKSALAMRQRMPAPRRALLWLVSKRAPDFALYPRMADAIIINRVFGGRIDDRSHAIQVFERHINDVKASIPRDRLLVYDVQDGWAPLCNFLGCPQPNEDFPHNNLRRAFNRNLPTRLLRLVLLGR